MFSHRRFSLHSCPRCKTPILGNLSPLEGATNGPSSSEVPTSRHRDRSEVGHAVDGFPGVNGGLWMCLAVQSMFIRRPSGPATGKIWTEDFGTSFSPPNPMTDHPPNWWRGRTAPRDAVNFLHQNHRTFEASKILARHRCAGLLWGFVMWVFPHLPGEGC